MIRPEQRENWRLVLDANILLQAAMRDTILRLAEASIVSAFWSESILAEVERNFSKVSGGVDVARRYAALRGALSRNFPRALVRVEQRALATLAIAPHDHHVVACALAAPAAVIVTYNTRHFPQRGLHPHGIRTSILEVSR